MTLALELTATSFREAGEPYLSARRVSERLGLPLTDIAAMTGVARTTLTAKSGRRRVDAALSPLVRIIAMAAEMAGDEGRAAIWFKHQPLPGWGGKTAYDLVREGKSDRVLDYLESVRAGVYS
ncbi:antitoxin Xre/MbcA/ParS toxin-binding domain-containing protein [Bosea sp. R86505]|uniref:antitoxin Xre/MbcA/ParS toxin-binding domain-containing protein n=1 Tax=Bosea sp. R86505 TaxID=3101710 RepID=UPI00366CCC51